MKNTNNILIQKLEAFLRKYYQNRLIKGLIISISMLLLSFLLFAFSEYWGNFGSLVRSLFFYSFVGLAVFVFTYYVFIPIFQMLRFGKRITYEEAAKIIGKHFPEVSDKLLNTLQLNELVRIPSPSTTLIEASIEQKTLELKPFNFRKSVDFRVNTKYLKFLLVPLFLVLFLVVFSPSIITEPTQRIIQHNETFEKKFPFEIQLLNPSLKVLQYETYVLNVKLSGSAIPEQVFLNQDNTLIPLEKKTATTYQYRFERVQKNITFNLQAGDFDSEEYQLKVVPKPMLLQMEILANYPAYIGREDENMGQSGNLTIPQGTTIDWNLYTKNTDSIAFVFRSDSLSPYSVEGNLFVYKKRIMKSGNYQISFQNKFIDTLQPMQYSIQVIPDAYPQIFVEEFADTLMKENAFFKTIIKDDYGFNKLVFSYQKVNADGEMVYKESIDLPIQPMQIPQEVFYQYDFSSLLQEAGEEVKYYFQVWDNDAVNGSKSTKSPWMSFKTLSKSELQEKTDNTNKEIKSTLEKMQKDAKELNKDIKEFDRKLFEKKELSWEDKKKLKELLKRQEDLKQKAEKLQQKSIENREENEKFSEVDKALLEKQKQLEELLEELKKNEALKKMLEEMEKMMEQVKKEDVEEMLDKMQLDTKEMEKMLDRNIELFKKLQLEMKMDQNLKKLQEMAKKQEELAKETREKKKKSSLEESMKEQEKLNKDFEKWQEEMNEMEQMNEELEKPGEMDTMKEKQQETKEDMEKSSQEMKNQKTKKASKSQKSAAQKMQEMEEQMEAMMQASAQGGAQEDMEVLRQILDNLINLSFAQEDLMAKVEATSINNPEYLTLVQNQKNIQTEFKVVNDSLTALSKRQMMIAPFISKEIAKVEEGLSKSLLEMEERKTMNAQVRQQNAMTAFNNLALMLSEALNQMQNASSSSSCPNGKPKPGGQPKPGDMKGLQQQMQQQLEQMKKSMAEGKTKGDGKGKPKGGMSEKMARMAAQQRALRQQMQEMGQQMQAQGNTEMAKELKKAAEQMNKTETELVNKMITAQTIRRQQDIITRLLKSEKAELKREKDKKREAKQGHNNRDNSSLGKDHFKKKNKANNELLKSYPPELKYFYRRKLDAYFYQFNKNE